MPTPCYPSDYGLFAPWHRTSAGKELIARKRNELLQSMELIALSKP